MAFGQEPVQCKGGFAGKEEHVVLAEIPNGRGESQPRPPSLWAAKVHPWLLVVDAPAVHVCQLLEAAAPVIQVIVILVLVRAGGVEGTEGAGLGATALVIEHQQGVIGGRRGVRVCRLQVLQEQGEMLPL